MNARPELVVARAAKPEVASTRAEPASHGFGRTNGSPACSAAKSAPRSAWLRIAHDQHDLAALARLLDPLEGCARAGERERESIATRSCPAAASRASSASCSARGSTTKNTGVTTRPRAAMALSPPTPGAHPEDPRSGLASDVAADGVEDQVDRLDRVEAASLRGRRPLAAPERGGHVVARR